MTVSHGMLDTTEHSVNTTDIISGIIRHVIHALS
jgi:hypothetical protein